MNKFCCRLADKPSCACSARTIPPPLHQCSQRFHSSFWRDKFRDNAGNYLSVVKTIAICFLCLFWQCVLELMEDNILILSQRQLFPAVGGSAQSTKLICWLHFCLFSRLFRKVAVLHRGKNRFLQSVFPVFLCCWGCFLVCTCLKEGDGPGLLPWICFFPGLIGHP